VGHARRVRGEVQIAREVRALRDFAEFPELAVVADGQHDFSVLGVMQRVVPEPQSYVVSRGSRRRDGADSKRTSEGAMKLVFRDPVNRRMFVLWAITAGLLQFGYYGVSNWMPTYLVSNGRMGIPSFVMDAMQKAQIEAAAQANAAHADAER